MRNRKDVTALPPERPIGDTYLQPPIQVFSASAIGAEEHPFGGGGGNPLGDGGEDGGKGGGEAQKKRWKGKGRAMDFPDDGDGGDRGGGRGGPRKEPQDPPADGRRSLANSDEHMGQCILYNFPDEVREVVFEHLLNHDVVRYDPHNPPAEAGPSGVRRFEGDVLPPLPAPARQLSYSYSLHRSRAPGYDLSFELMSVLNHATRDAAEAHFEEHNQLIQMCVLYENLSSFNSVESVDVD